MIKFIKIILLLMLALAGAAPFGAGILIENHYNDMIASLNNFNKENSGKLKFEGAFKRGYLRSNAKTKVTVLDDSAKSFELTHDILHGPVIINFKGWKDTSSYIPRGYKLAVINTKLDSNINMALMLLYSGKTAYDIISELAYDRTSDTYMSIYPLTFPIGKTGSFNWQGINLRVYTTKNFSNVISEMTMPLIHYTGAEGVGVKEVKVSSFKINHNIDINETLKGILTMHLDSAYALAADHNIFNLDQATIIISDEKDKDLIKADMNYGFNKLKLADDEYGPLALSFNIKNISVKALENIVEAVPQQDISGASIQANIHIPPEQMLALLAARPTVDINLKLGVPNGKIDLLASLTAGGKELASIDPQAISDTLSANVTLKVSKSVVYACLLKYAQDQIHGKEKQFAATNKDPKLKNPYTLSDKQMQKVIDSWAIVLLDVLKKQFFFTEDKESMVTHVVFDQKILTVNDKTKQISEVMDLLKYLNVNVAKSSDTNTPPPALHNNLMVIPAIKTKTGPAKGTSTTAPGAGGKTVGNGGGKGGNGGGSNNNTTTNNSNTNDNSGSSGGGGGGRRK